MLGTLWYGVETPAHTDFHKQEPQHEPTTVVEPVEPQKPQEQIKPPEAEKVPEVQPAVMSEPVAPPEKPTYPSGCELYRPLVEQYDWNTTVAMQIMQAESNCDPNAANWNDSHNICQGSFGLFQISCHSGQIYEPAENIRIAYQKYQARNWQPWGATTCKYKVQCY